MPNNHMQVVVPRDDATLCPFWLEYLDKMGCGNGTGQCCHPANKRYRRCPKPGSLSSYTGKVPGDCPLMTCSVDVILQPEAATHA